MGVACFEADVAVGSNSRGGSCVSPVGEYRLARAETFFQAQTAADDPDPGIPADAGSRTCTEDYSA